MIFHVERPDLKVSGPARPLFLENLGEIAQSAGAVPGYHPEIPRVWGDFLGQTHEKSSCLMIFHVERPDLKVSGPVLPAFFQND